MSRPQNSSFGTFFLSHCDSKMLARTLSLAKHKASRISAKHSTTLTAFQLVGNTEIHRVSETSNAFKDYTSEHGASSFVIAWPVQEQKTEEIAQELRENLEGCQGLGSSSSHSFIHMTKPFFMLDGRGDKMASVCLIQSPESDSRKRKDSLNLPFWLNEYRALMRP